MQPKNKTDDNSTEPTTGSTSQEVQPHNPVNESKLPQATSYSPAELHIHKSLGRSVRLSRTFWIIMAAVLVVTSGICMWLFLRHHDVQNQTAAPATQVAAIDTRLPYKKDATKEGLRVFIENMKAMGTADSWIDENWSFGNVNLPGYRYSVPTYDTDGMRVFFPVGTDENLVEINKDIAAVFTTYQMTPQKQLTLLSNGPDIMANDSFACHTRSVQRMDNNGPNNVTPFAEVTCTTLAALYAGAEVFVPFYDTILAERIPSLNYVDMEKYKVIDSETAGYKTVVIAGLTIDDGNDATFLDTGLARFYQTPDQQWHLLKDYALMLQCGALKTDDEQKAFKGQQCYNGDAPAGKVAASTNPQYDPRIVLGQIRMNMTKEEVIASVGQPYSCDSSSVKENDTAHLMENCYYGEKEASGHALITFLNGKVWGTTYELGKIPN